MSSLRKPASNPTETEAKIRVASFVVIQRRIKVLRGRLIHVRTLETNTLFDSANDSLRAAGQSFRVRRYGDSGALTLKGPAKVQAGLKSRIEWETPVGSPETAEQILGALGFVAQFRYEKFREMWKVGNTVVCLDETPVGRFVEIEGTASAIHKIAAQLGFNPAEFLTVSYPSLWVESGRPGHMVFPSRKARETKAAKPRRSGSR